MDAERAVLGAMLRDPSSLGPAFEVLGRDGFYSENHLKIYCALEDLYMRSEPTDLFTVSEELRRRGEIEQVGGTAYLATLQNSVATSANVEHHARIVKDKAVLRTLIQNCLDVAERGFREEDSAYSLVEDMQRNILDLSQNARGDGFRHVSTILNGVIDHIQEVRSTRERVTGVATGYDRLDDMTSGFQHSDLVK